VFEEGKTTALVGPSGSGKSTIIQLLERFYDPTSGQVTLDGVDIKDINLKSMRQLIGYVGQEPVLFNCSIKQNMLFAKPDATDDEIISALKAANAWDFIVKKMGSQGINVQVGGSGGQLSGGQKQRIAIARAFLKKPRILLLDEATSALDKMNEKAIQAAIDNYKKTTGNITTIVIAHRLSTIRDADKIVVLKSGELIEMGSHDELLANFPEGTYAGFCEKQQSAEA
jgi:ATP-binding cassette subfamily B (MDR/TAP) protein 1